MIQEKIEPIDIHNYEARKEAGLLWYNGVFKRDASVWTKTDKEKKALKKAKKGHYPPFMTSWTFTKMSIPCYDKLIIQLNVSGKSNKYFLEKHGYNSSQSTLSISCGQSEIPNILAKFYVEKTDQDGNKHSESIVKKYKWNGKWYRPNELPTYYW